METWSCVIVNQPPDRLIASSYLPYFNSSITLLPFAGSWSAFPFFIVINRHIVVWGACWLCLHSELHRKSSIFICGTNVGVESGVRAAAAKSLTEMLCAGGIDFAPGGNNPVDGNIRVKYTLEIWNEFAVGCATPRAFNLQHKYRA